MAAIATRNVQENLARQLSDSVERLQKQVEKVEFWASALTGFSRPRQNIAAARICSISLWIQ